MNRPAVRGYTLIEMMVVVALLALATAMVAPSGYRMVASWREASDVTAVMRTIASLPHRARADGVELRFPAGDPTAVSSLISLPDGWSVELQAPLIVRPNGACTQTTGVLITMRQRLDFKVDAPFCRTHPTPAGT